MATPVTLLEFLSHDPVGVMAVLALMALGPTVGVFFVRRYLNSPAFTPKPEDDHA